jgi:hypothetical protein
LKIFKSLTFELKSLFEKLKTFFCSPIYPALFLARFNFLSFPSKSAQARPPGAFPPPWLPELPPSWPALLRRASLSTAPLLVRANEPNRRPVAFISPTESMSPRLAFLLFGFETAEL